MLFFLKLIFIKTMKNFLETISYYSIFNIIEKWLLKITKSSKKYLNLSNNANLINAVKCKIKSAKSCTRNISDHVIKIKIDLFWIDTVAILQFKKCFFSSFKKKVKVTLWHLLLILNKYKNVLLATIDVNIQLID